MAFCTSCGAQVKGAFCENCGTPVSAAAGAAPQMSPPQMTPPQMSPPQMSAPPMSAPPQMVTKKMNPLVIILLVVLGFVALGFVGCVVSVWWIARNPAALIAKAVTAANPDAEVVSTDSDARQIRIRDRKTGEEFTMSFDDAKNGRFHMQARGRKGEVANIDIGAGTGKLPSWVPVYPGAKAQGNFSATGDDGKDSGNGGIVAFESPDSPEKVTDFYKEKINGLGMKVVTDFSSNEGGMMMAQDPDEKRTLHVTVGKGSGGGSSIGVTFGEKK